MKMKLVKISFLFLTLMFISGCESNISILGSYRFYYGDELCETLKLFVDNTFKIYTHSNSIVESKDVVSGIWKHSIKFLGESSFYQELNLTYQDKGYGKVDQFRIDPNKYIFYELYNYSSYRVERVFKK